MTVSRSTTVYIPNFNGARQLPAALESLRRQTVPVEVVVADNGSADDSRELVRRDFPEVQLLELGENLGFSRALNRAVRELPAERVIFLNGDTECEPRFVEALLEQLGPGAPMVAAVLLKQDNPDVIDSAGVVADRTLLAFDHLYGLPAAAAKQASPPLGPTGGAALFTLEAFSSVGGFDERIFIYLEDLDIALRLRCNGMDCRLAPDARALHRHSATFGSGSPTKNRLMGWSRGYMLRRYRVLLRRGRFRALAGEAVIAGGQILIDRNGSGIAGRIAGWRAAGGLPSRRLPADSLLDISFIDAMRRRSQRRRVLNSTLRTGAELAEPG
jgi:GT2 family glycosyltransferase